MLVQAVKRNLARFPDDFRFQLSAEKLAHLSSKNCDLKCRQPDSPTGPSGPTGPTGHGGRRTTHCGLIDQPD